jgi:hypothetical protein
MIQLVLILIIAFTLLVVVGLLLRDAFGRGLGDRDTPETASLQADIPSRALMGRIFAEEDLGFVAAEHSRQLRRQFLGERRRLALCWLGQTRREATRILRLHLRVVRTDGALQLAVELKLIFHTFLFFAVYGLLWSLVSCNGPFWARSFMGNFVLLAGRLSGLGGNILADAGRSGLRMAQSQSHA